MPHTYYLIEDTIFDESEREHIVYGIQAIDENRTVLISFPDVFFDRRKANHFVNLCNKGMLSLLHLADIVEDAITEQYTLLR